MSSQIGLRGHRIQNRERASARRRAILIAAGRVFARQGYAAASLDEIAEQLGLTKGVIYYYFPSKEAIYTEILVTAIGDEIQRLEAIVARTEPPEPTLRAAIYDLVSHTFDDLAHYAHILRASASVSVDSRDQIRAHQRRYEQLIRGVVQDGIQAGVFVAHDPTLIVFTMLRAVLGVGDWYSPGGRLSPEVISEQVTEQVVRGVLRRPDGDAH